jgi:dihydropteroate synthase
VFPPRHSYTVPLAHGSALRLGERCLVLGVLNVTPDSFAESPSARHDTAAFLDRAFQIEADGADLIDIGGESTRPGADPVPAEVEAARLLPVLNALAGRLGIPVSVDTSKAEIARQAIDAGAALVNDVSGLGHGPALAQVVAAAGAALVLMHTRGTPRTMNSQAVYEDVIAEVTRELRERLSVAAAAGVPMDHLIVDPGIGFAKRPSHSYGVLARLPELAAALDRPVLVGPSRKSFMREAVGERPAQERDWGTAAAVAAAVLAGAHIVRVHRVAEMVQVVRVSEEIRREGLRTPIANPQSLP